MPLDEALRLLVALAVPGLFVLGGLWRILSAVKDVIHEQQIHRATLARIEAMAAVTNGRLANHETLIHDSRERLAHLEGVIIPIRGAHNAES